MVGAVAGAPVEFAGFIAEFDGMLLLAGFVVELVVVVVVVVEFVTIVLVVATGAGVLAGVEGLVLALLAGVSPQAIPNAPRPRTAESTITFFICLRTPIFLKD